MSTTPDAPQPEPQPHAQPEPQPTLQPESPATAPQAAGAEQPGQPAPGPQYAPPAEYVHPEPPQAPAFEATGVQHPVPSGATQPTAPLLDAPAAGGPAYAAAPTGGAVPPGFGGPAPTATAEPAPARARNGGLVAGLVVGALIGGLVGGGTAAVVAHNTGSQTVAQSEKSGSLTLNNMESATAISGVAAVATQSVVTLQVSSDSASGSGSGVIYSDDGYIITNAHVTTLEGATSDPQIQVQTSDGHLYPGTLVGSDPFADIAVVKIDAEGLTPVKVADSDQINVGDLAVVIGAPLNLSNTVTSGVISALNRGISVASSMVSEEDPAEGGDSQQQQQQQQQGSPFPWFQFQNPNGQGQSQSPQATARVAIPVIQTDASINPGNSGGALLNANGELIGINVALASMSSSTGAAGSDGLGFAVPSNLAVRVADSLIAGEQPSHGLLGVQQTGSGSTADQAGGVIGEVVPGSAADKAGLRAGDVITSVDGVMADSFTTVTALVRMHPAGSEITIGYNRDGKQLETKVTLGTLEW